MGRFANLLYGLKVYSATSSENPGVWRSLNYLWRFSFERCFVAARQQTLLKFVWPWRYLPCLDRLCCSPGSTWRHIQRAVFLAPGSSFLASYDRFCSARARACIRRCIDCAALLCVKRCGDKHERCSVIDIEQSTMLYEAVCILCDGAELSRRPIEGFCCVFHEKTEICECCPSTCVYIPHHTSEICECCPSISHTTPQDNNIIPVLVHNNDTQSPGDKITLMCFRGLYCTRNWGERECMCT